MQPTQVAAVIAVLALPRNDANDQLDIEAMSC
jgi:hypothetical protein